MKVQLNFSLSARTVAWLHVLAIATAIVVPFQSSPAAPMAIPAQNWQTVDDFALGDGNAEARGVATDAAGGIYVVGTADGHGIVRYNADGGLNWITRDDFVFDSTTNTVFNAVTVDSQGTVFVGGTGGGHWLVRRSTDHGITWETVDDYWRPFQPPEEPGTNGVVYSLSSDGQGRVYGAGPLIRTHCPCYNTWWVRGSSIGGTNWDTKLVMSSGYGGINQATCAGEDVYATGTADGGGEGNMRLLLRSSDHGATWSTIFQATNDLHNAITADLAGNFYFAGAGWSPNSFNWLVRRAAPGGTNWTALDGSSYAAEPPVTQGQPDGAYIALSSIAVDAAGNVAVAGTFIAYWVISIPNGTYHGADWTWVTGQYSAATGQWSTTDQFSYSTNRNGYANGVAIAPSGSVFTVGYGTSDSGQRRWVVRKQAAQAAPGPTADSLSGAINGLVQRGTLNHGQGKALTLKLEAAEKSMNAGRISNACNHLNAFVNQVSSLVQQGTLSQAIGQALTNQADALRVVLGCQ